MYMAAKDGGASIRRGVSDEMVGVYFQELVSMRDQSLIGVEGLCRVEDRSGSLSSAGSVLDGVKNDDELIGLDRLFRRRVMEEFLPLSERHPELALFLNFETSLVDRGVVGSGHILETAEKTGLDPGRVVIEVVESEANDLDLLMTFAAFQRANGFLIALSDTGSMISSLDRIALLRPDLIKIHMDVVRDIDRNTTGQEIFRGLVNMSRRVGALVVAMGVEREQEALTCLDLGADILQGYALSHPWRPGDDSRSECLARASELGKRFKELRRRRAEIERARMLKYSRVADRIIPVLGSKKRIDFDEAIGKIIREHKGVECVYILDTRGIQVTETIFNEKLFPDKKKLIYKPAPRRADLSLKEYYLAVRNGQRRFVSRPYVSLATGARCVTLSAPFKDAHGMEHIVCMDFEAESSLEFERSYLGLD